MLRVLVVDDDEDTVDSQTAWLVLLGCDVRVAGDGPAAVSVAQQFLPHVVLLDIGLPGVNGYVVARHIRAAMAQTRLVAVTGWAGNGDRKRADEAGFDHFLAKPVDLTALRELLASVHRRPSVEPQ